MKECACKICSTWGEYMNKIQFKHYLIEALSVQGVGWHSIDRIIRHELHKQKQWTDEQLEALGFQKKLAGRLCHFHNAYCTPSLDELYEREQRNPYEVITYWDERYPLSLKQIAQPPWLLFALGRVELLREESVAIVGTRYPTIYGKQCAKQFSGEFAGSGVTVVSGFANGIDTIAHKEALRYCASSIAILPSAILHCYPANNYKLYEQFKSDGLLLSESVHPMPIHPGQFHARNRIIAGLSRATVVIEGEKKSGSMITARHAMEMDRELFAVPGSIYSKKSEGPNFLIEKGYARMLLTSQQLFEELTWLQHHSIQQDETCTKLTQDAETLSQDELFIYTYIKSQPRSINEIHEHTLIPFGHLNVLLLNLCIKQMIELQPGSIYIAL
jgi:DNA processing protein